MELQVGKSLKYKNSDKVSKIAKITSEDVYFTDNSVAPIQLVTEKYEELSMSELINTNTTPNIDTQVQTPIQEPIGFTDELSSMISQTSQTVDMTHLKDKIEKSHGGYDGDTSREGKSVMVTNENVSNPFGQNNTIQNNIPSTVPTIIGGKDYSHYDEKTRITIIENLNKQKEFNSIQEEKDKVREEAIKNDPFYDQFKDSVPIKSQSMVENEERLEWTTKLNNREITKQEFDEKFGIEETQSTIPQIVKKQSKLPKMRKLKEVKLVITLSERIPKLEDIRAVESLFDDVSIIEELGKEIANKYLSDPSLFEDIIIGELQKKVKTTKKVTRPK